MSSWQEILEDFKQGLPPELPSIPQEIDDDIPDYTDIYKFIPEEEKVLAPIPSIEVYHVNN